MTVTTQTFHSPDVRVGGRGRLWPLSVAPMMEWTDRHFRYLCRRLTKKTLLYTEMVTAAAVVRGNQERLLGYNPQEHPIALQLGGDDPILMAQAARIGQDFGYDEININVGCPSSRVQNGNFGACLMSEPKRVADLVSRMRSAVAIPVTVKHRIGIDGLEDYEDLARFVETVAAARCDRFVVHARIAILSGLSPLENRTVPPLRYADVFRLKQDFPHLSIEINGGIRDLDLARQLLRKVDGVMMGRAVYDDPYLLAQADRLFADMEIVSPESGSREPTLSRHEVVREMIPYVEQQVALGLKPGAVTRHMLGLFSGLPGARAWRRHLSEYGPKTAAGRQLLTDALRHVSSVDHQPLRSMGTN